ncbi:MAG: thiamine pyrophosphate-dependent dehydrogenase E1 component subunit alpha [Alphaproteobacteria bacterium]
MKNDRPLAMFRDMVRIRHFEERIRNLASAGRVPGLTHLYSGQEAVAVGVISALEQTDWIASHHRGHGHCLAKGAVMERLFAEILGRRSGYGLGRVGSMHIMDPENRNLGCNGIVGGGVPLATGAAMTSLRSGSDAVTVAFFGDGALNQGIVFECMNMAAIWRLPVLFVCENNRYGEFTAIDDVTAGDRLAARAETFAIPTAEIDGMNVIDVNQAATDAVARARGGGGPGFLLCETYRFGGHHVGDDQSYKDDAERLEWEARDPILRLRTDLGADHGMEETALAAIESEIEGEVQAALDAAMSAPEPTIEDYAEHLYAG